MNAARPASVDAKVPAGEDPVNWAIKTGRISAGGDLERSTRAMASQSRDAAVRLVEQLAPGRPPVHVTPAVAAAAAARGVDVRDVKGTGAGGRITIADVKAAAPMAGEDDAMYDALFLDGNSGAPASRHVSAASPSSISDWRYARNPLAAKYAAEKNPAFSAASRSGVPAPTLFAAGDLPLMTASGISPQLLLQVPWQLRHGLAAADGATASRLLEDFGGPGGGDFADVAPPPEAAHPGTQDYIADFSTWLATAGLE